MISQLKQFVPSNVCLKCDGCCRFQLSDSPWRPKVGEQELKEGVDPEGYLKTIPQGGHHQCTHFNQTDNTCGVYSKRPFECALYPFIISSSSRGVEVYVHLACPYVQENEIKPEMQEYILYLKNFLNQLPTKAFLTNNSRLLHDYTPFNNELKFLFRIEG